MSIINKIVELKAEIDGIEFDDIAVEIMSLVEAPAIGVNWAAFAAHQFVDAIPGESKDNYLGRCIPQLIKEGYTQDEAAAICYDSYAEDTTCPAATQDIATNLKNRQNAINVAHYGPLNPNLPNEEYWTAKGKQFNTTAEAAKQSLCANCSFFNVGPKVEACIASGIGTEGGDPMDVIDAGQLGYCEAFDFKCASKRTCDAWVAGGPVTMGTDSGINTNGLPDYVDELGTKPKIVKEIEFHNAVLEFASKPEVGEVLDIANTTFVNLAKQEFETVTEFLRGIDALDILSQLSGSGAQQVPEPSYRYTGPGAQRNFCRALMALNKIYTRNEISMMDGVNFGFGPNGSNFYSIFDYKGGVNCQHYWEQLRVFRTAGGQNIVISEGPAVGLAGESCNSSEPSPTGYIRNNARLSSEWTFAADEDQHIITGPAMRPWQMIPRKDEKTGEIFHVYFSADTVKKLSEKFLKEHKQHMTDINHSMNPNEENTLIESWIVEDPTMDKSVALGFEPAKGDWYVSYKINNEETWNQIKEGKLKGFSIAGQFIERTTNKNG